MDQVIIFDKSLQQRLQEYNDVLAGYEVLPVSAIQREWAFYLELTLEVSGWQAVWKIQRKTCEALNIPFPSVVLVVVLELDLEDLSALVRVLAVQDDIHLLDRHRVPLIHLYPTKEQDKSIVLNLHSTANALDMLRFFYNNLFMPWDQDDDETTDWKSKHLESRLRLFYDMKNGVIPRATAEHLRGLFTEAKRLQSKRQELELDLEDLDDDDSVNLNDKKLQSLMEIHVRLMEIKGEVDILENPVLRGAIIKKHKLSSASEGGDTTQNIWVIYEQGTVSNCVEFLTKIDKIFPNEVLKFSPSLSSTLECANSHDVFILNSAKHEIKTTGALEHGGEIRGVSPRDNTILTSKIEDVMLDFKGDVLLENLTIEATSPQCAVIVRGGQLCLKNCKLTGDRKSSTHQGIIVLGEGSLEIVDCDISNFCTAIVGNSGSLIKIENSEIYDCNFGLKIYDNCALNANKAIIRNCKEYGICVETENNLTEDGPRVGDFDTLNIIPKLQMEFIKGNDNTKGDAIINQKSTLKPVEDLFENPDSDPTVCVESDEEMETQNITVIENVCDGRMSPATV